MESLGIDLAVTLAYGGVGILLMTVGYILVDLATPGSLREQIWMQRNRNAALLLGSNLAGVGIIVVAAIVASADDFGVGIVSALAYGALGLALMAGAFVLLDIATPGRLGALLVDPEPHPAVGVTAVVHVATGAIIAAAIL
jgi:DNA-binding transcriptional LysR family regulator